MTSPVARAAAKPLLEVRHLQKFFPVRPGFFAGAVVARSAPSTT